jgi:hypothetical protein
LSNHESTYQQWVPIIGRSLAYLCIQVGELREGSLADKAAFLEAAGIERKDVAAMLGTTYASVTETLSKAKRNKKGGKSKNARKGKKR